MLAAGTLISLDYATELVVPLVAAVMGVGGISLGVLFRLGHLRPMARWYHDRHQPFYVRNLPFGQIPFGGMFLAWFALFVLAATGYKVAALIVGYSSFLLFVLGVAFMVRPPRFLKPRWPPDRAKL